MLDHVRAAALEDEHIKKYGEVDDEALRGFKRARYEESKPIRVTSYVESCDEL